MRMRSSLGGLPLLVAALTVAAGCGPTPGVVAPGPGVATAPSGAPSTAPSASPVASAAPTASPVAAAFTLAGTVTDINRDPVAGATVTVGRGEEMVATATTAADGTYTLQVAGGTYEVVASRSGLTTRRQPLTLTAGQTLNFGPVGDDQLNPFFLADTPEVAGVEVEETAPGGPLTLRVRLSEPLPADAQKSFDDRFELRAGRSVEFLTSQPFGAFRQETKSTWEENGQVYVFTYPGPYLASGETDVEYTAKLDQDARDTRDPVTREFDYVDMKIADAAGNAIGRGRADYAFVKPLLELPTAEMLTDPERGYLVQDRRWRLTHADGFTFKARRDETPPGLERVEVKVDTQQGERRADVLTLYFTEPMSVARDLDELEWTRLDVDRPFVILNVAADAAGKDFKPLGSGAVVQELTVSRTDPKIVSLQYPRETFKDQEFVEVTLTPDAQDPAGNKPDPKRNRLTGPVAGG